MKIYSSKLIIALVTIWMAACNQPQAPESLEEKKQELAELKKEQVEIKEKIVALQEEIASISGENKQKDLRRIEAIQLTAQPFNHFIEVQGEVQSDQNVMVTPEMNGVILKRLAQEGDFVKAGQVIVVLDAEVLKRTIAEIETKLELANTMYERQKNLWEQQIGSEVQYLQAKNTKESLEKNLEAQKAQLANANVKSPISGVLDEFFMNKGEMATPSAPLARVVNVAQVKISADVSEAYTKYVKKGDSVTVNFPAIGENIKVPIRHVGQFINAQNRTFRIEMKASNKDGFLKPNTLAVVKINDFSKEDAVVVPSNIIQKATNGDTFVFAIDKKDKTGKVKKVVIKSSKSFNGKSLVEEGLKPGDYVVGKGYNEVVAGDEVNIVEERKI